MIFESKKGRTKVLGSKFSRNSYFSRSRLIVWPPALRHLIFASIWTIWQKLCWNCVFSHFCDRDYMSVCSWVFCSVGQMCLLRCFFFCGLALSWNLVRCLDQAVMALWPRLLQKTGRGSKTSTHGGSDSSPARHFRF